MASLAQKDVTQATIAATMRYVDPSSEHKRKAAEKLERLNVEQLFDPGWQLPATGKLSIILTRRDV